MGCFLSIIILFCCCFCCTELSIKIFVAFTIFLLNWKSSNNWNKVFCVAAQINNKIIIIVKIRENIKKYPKKHITVRRDYRIYWHKIFTICVFLLISFIYLFFSINFLNHTHTRTRTETFSFVIIQKNFFSQTKNLFNLFFF